MLSRRSWLLVSSLAFCSIILCVTINQQLRFEQTGPAQNHSTRKLLQLLYSGTGNTWTLIDTGSAANDDADTIVHADVSASPAHGRSLLGLFSWHRTAKGDKSNQGIRAASYEASAASATSESASASNAPAQQAINHNLTSLVKLWFHHNVSIAKEWPEVRKECHMECSTYGNCNHETGQCDCPYGRTGVACKEMFAPACR
jgi:hypothetical protein